MVFSILKRKSLSDVFEISAALRMTCSTVARDVRFPRRQVRAFSVLSFAPYHLKRCCYSNGRHRSTSLSKRKVPLTLSFARIYRHRRFCGH
ncbi:hypothetical protein MTO96_032360 [Rhipicephalus appendiculatus]